MKTKDMVLNPNCSEAVMRIDLDSISKKEKERIVEFLERCKNVECGEVEDGDINEHWYDTYWNEASIFDKRLIEISGDTPFNSGEWLEDRIRQLAPKARIETSES